MAIVHIIYISIYYVRCRIRHFFFFLTLSALFEAFFFLLGHFFLSFLHCTKTDNSIKKEGFFFGILFFQT